VTPKIICCFLSKCLLRISVWKCTCLCDYPIYTWLPSGI